MLVSLSADDPTLSESLTIGTKNMLWQSATKMSILYPASTLKPLERIRGIIKTLADLHEALNSAALPHYFSRNHNLPQGSRGPDSRMPIRSFHLRAWIFSVQRQPPTGNKRSLARSIAPPGLTTRADEVNSEIPASGFVRYPIESLS
jgi:hypothetical protein